MKKLILNSIFACVIVWLLNGIVYGQIMASSDGGSPATGNKPARAPGLAVPQCDQETSGVPAWGIDGFTTVSFVSSDTFVIPASNGATEAIWSDLVQATDCQKTAFNGGTEEKGFNSDCRNIPGFQGSLFSWCAVARYKHELCPLPWRVPLKEDFINLDRALGGTGLNGQYTSPFNNPVRNYQDTLDCEFTGYCDGCGVPNYQNTHTLYWSESSHSTSHAYYLNLHIKGNIHPQNYNCKYYGLALRCVK